MNLAGKVALITGAGSGIGRALAIEGARRGLELVLVGRREAALEKTREQIDADGRVDIVVADITLAADRKRIYAAVEQRCGGLDLLINNAGVVEVGAFGHGSDEITEAMLAVNLMAPINLTRCLLPLVQKKGGGRIVNIGSMFGDIAFPYFAAYSASKFGLRGFSEGLRRELVQEQIGVTYVAPRGVRTPAADSFAKLVAPMGMKLDDASAVALHIWNGIAREARDIYPRGPERIFLLLQRLFPRLIDGNLSKLTGDPAVREAVQPGQG